MATSFGEPKLKAFPWRPRSDRLAGLMQTCLFILAVNWCLQGMRGMDGKELSFRLGLEALVAALIAGALLDPLGAPSAVALGLLVAHSLNFTLNGQLWVCARYCRRYRGDAQALDAFLGETATHLARLPWLREAACIGSLGRIGAGPRSDLDLRLLFPPGPLAWLRVNLLLLRLRSRALVRRIPLDLYAYATPERLRRFDQREPLLLLLDRDGRLAALFRRRAVPWR